MSEEELNQQAEQLIASLKEMFGQKAVDVVINYPIQFEYYYRLYKFYTQRAQTGTGLIPSE